MLQRLTEKLAATKESQLYQLTCVYSLLMVSVGTRRTDLHVDSITLSCIHDELILVSVVSRYMYNCR